MIHIRLIGIWESAQNACRSTIENHRFSSSRGRCLELLNLGPTHNLESALLLQAKTLRQETGSQCRDSYLERQS